MLRSALPLVINVFVSVFIAIGVGAAVFTVGYMSGYSEAHTKAQEDIAEYIASVSSAQYGEPQPTPTPIVQPVSTPRTIAPHITWSGPDLWVATNTRRTQLGVNPLDQRDELCTIASIRLNELLEAGKLDGHEGFSNLPERRPDLKWIFEKYNNVSEFLVSGAQTAQQAVDLWENTLGHKKLLTGGEYVWGCIYAQDSFGVAITAF